MADCKLASSANLREIAAHGGKFVTVLPRTRKEDKRFRRHLRQHHVRWKKILKIQNKRSETGLPDVFYSCAAPELTGEGFRVIWVRSSAKAQLA